MLGFWFAATNGKYFWFAAGKQSANGKSYSQFKIRISSKIKAQNLNLGQIWRKFGIICLFLKGDLKLGLRIWILGQNWRDSSFILEKIQVQTGKFRKKLQKYMYLFAAICCLWFAASKFAVKDLLFAVCCQQMPCINSQCVDQKI